MGEDRREKARNLLLTEIFDADSQIMRLQSQIRELLQKAVDLDIQRLGYVEKITMDCMGLYHYAIDARDKEHRLYPESMYKEGEELYRPPYMGQEPGHPGREQGAAPGQEPAPPAGNRKPPHRTAGKGQNHRKKPWKKRGIIPICTTRTGEWSVLQETAWGKWQDTGVGRRQGRQDAAKTTRPHIFMSGRKTRPQGSWERHQGTRRQREGIPPRYT